MRVQKKSKKKVKISLSTIISFIVVILLVFYVSISRSIMKASESENIPYQESLRGEKASSKLFRTKRTKIASFPLHNDLLLAKDAHNVGKHGKYKHQGDEDIWDDILNKGVKLMEKNGYKEHLTVFEVGAQQAKQSLDAAKKLFHAHLIEPSPISFEKITNQMKKEVHNNPTLGKFIHLYNVAAGDESGSMLDFHTTGGTGDHIGEYNIWEMKKGPVPDEWPEDKKGQIVKIPSLRLDDIIYYNKVKPNQIRGLERGQNPPFTQNVWAVKVDTQGFEPKVFAGLKESIQKNKIQYILTEYWPNGMGLLNDRMDNRCDLGVEMLSILVSAGYSLYALPAAYHPAGKTNENGKYVKNWTNRPLNDAKADCQFLVDLEKKFPNPNYHVGYWTNILAVAPGAELIEINKIVS